MGRNIRNKRSVFFKAGYGECRDFFGGRRKRKGAITAENTTLIWKSDGIHKRSCLDRMIGLLRLLRNISKRASVAASWGYVLYRDPSQFTIEEIMRATDERMYQMKIDHKNK